MKDILSDYFEYISIPKNFDKEAISKNVNSLREEFVKQAKEWNKELNSQWVARDYIAVKMILSSSILLSSVGFANEKNLRIVEPYLIYYSLLSCSRAVVLTSPFHLWNNGKIMTMAHQKTINIVGDIISHYNKEIGEEIKGFIDWAREYREIFSYKIPANGLTKHHLSLARTLDICTLLCEIAQLQSVILEQSITKHVKQGFDLDWNILSVGCEYGGKNFKFIDSEDGYRLGYITRKQNRPYSLRSTMTEGMIEDFFGAWCSKDEDADLDEVFNPDANWQIIFPVP